MSAQPASALLAETGVLSARARLFLIIDHGVKASVTEPYARAFPVANVVTAKLRWDLAE